MAGIDDWMNFYDCGVEYFALGPSALSFAARTRSWVAQLYAGREGAGAPCLGQRDPPFLSLFVEAKRKGARVCRTRELERIHTYNYKKLY